MAWQGWYGGTCEAPRKQPFVVDTLCQGGGITSMLPLKGAVNTYDSIYRLMSLGGYIHDADTFFYESCIFSPVLCRQEFLEVLTTTFFCGSEAPNVLPP